MSRIYFVGVFISKATGRSCLRRREPRAAKKANNIEILKCPSEVILDFIKPMAFVAKEVFKYYSMIYCL